MAGYCGHRMSWNAIKAYDDGEMPITYWTKEELLSRIEDIVSDDEFEEIKKLSKDTLVYFFLYRSSWHHTGKYFKETNFYSFDYAYDIDVQDMIEHDKKLKKAKKAEKEEKTKDRQKIEYVYFTVREFEGTKRHPKIVEYEGKGIISGDYCYVVSYDGHQCFDRKRVDGKYFDYDSRRVYTRKPRDFNTVATTNVLKRNKLGRFAKTK